MWDGLSYITILSSVPLTGVRGSRSQRPLKGGTGARKYGRSGKVQEEINVFPARRRCHSVQTGKIFGKVQGEQEETEHFFC